MHTTPFAALWAELQAITDRRLRGAAFERMVLHYLRHEPLWASKLGTDANPARAQLWPDAPGRWRTRDLGTDLLVDTPTGMWAVQAKARTSDLDQHEVTSFLSDIAGHAAEGILVTTSHTLTQNAWEHIRDSVVPITVVRREHLDAWTGWPATLADLNPRHVAARTPRPLRDYQQHVVDTVTDKLTSLDRAQVVMACGTGKTLTAQRILEAQNPRTAVLLFPSLMLLRQSLEEFLADRTTDFSWLAVCSDTTVAPNTDETPETVSETGIPDVTTDPHTIAAFLDSAADRKLVFATYQSSPQVADALAIAQTARVDLLVCDEAHKMASTSANGVTGFTLPLDDALLPAAKRVFLTATPRVYGETIKTRAKNAGTSDLLASMDDTTRFGPRVVDYTFRQAIDAGHLADYQVLAVVVTERDIADQLARRDDVTVTGVDGTVIDTGTAAAAATHLAIAQAVQRYHLASVISFHSTIGRATDFADRHNDYRAAAGLPAAITGTVKGTDPVADRRRTLDLLTGSTGQTVVISNARCLTEGVDVPALSAVAFVDPRQSTIDIVQAVGRVIRKKLGSLKTTGYVIVPIFVPDTTETPGQDIDESAFATVIAVLDALRSMDEALEDTLNTLRSIPAGRRPTLADSGVPVTLVGANLLDASGLARALNVATLDAILARCTDTFWENLGQLVAFRQAHGRDPRANAADPHERMLGGWVNTQRKCGKQGTLPADRVAALNATPGWTWDKQATRWDEGHAGVIAFRATHGRDPRASATDPHEAGLGKWIDSQRQAYKLGTLSAARVAILSATPGWSWDKQGSRWNERHVEFGEHYRLHGRDPIGGPLGKWVNRQRQSYKQGTLSADRIAILNATPGWSWDKQGARWTARHSELIAFRAAHGRDPRKNAADLVERALGQWVSTQRKSYKQGALSADRIAALEQVDGWVWEPLAAHTR